MRKVVMGTLALVMVSFFDTAHARLPAPPALQGAEPREFIFPVQAIQELGFCDIFSRNSGRGMIRSVFPTRDILHFQSE